MLNGSGGVVVGILACWPLQLTIAILIPNKNSVLFCLTTRTVSVNGHGVSLFRLSGRLTEDIIIRPM